MSGLFWINNSLVAILAALAAGLVGADVKHETRGGVQAAGAAAVQEEEHGTVVIFSQACENLESFETF